MVLRNWPEINAALVSCVMCKDKIVLHYFPAFCKAGGRKILELRVIGIRCRQCGRYFFVCRQCYRGHVYCSVECREKGYKKRHQEAQKKYRAKEEKKELRREAEKERRYRNWVKGELLKNQQEKGNVDNEGTIDKIPAFSHTLSISSCHRENFFISEAPLSHGDKKIFWVPAGPDCGTAKSGEEKDEEKDSRTKNDGIVTVGAVGKCAFCGCEGVIVEKFSWRGNGKGKGKKQREYG